MGNTNKRDDYEIVFQIHNIVDVEIGWSIRFINKDLENILAKNYYIENINIEEKKIEEEEPMKKEEISDSKMIGLQGQYNRGKTFLINLLAR
eukprot:gnl/Spiro4/10714_TR5706_c0_g1_i1.p1 gnl/Spiro4/10714_TR5706_c0_g1~~gnl/Spiro4/10714_TR5706_c0_g1_i1.p1  ORF type:complete len:106 (+),score=10.75 gnl/Spiro4/10714_TR5706_c0_g1_i1:43-318(+)